MNILRYGTRRELVSHMISLKNEVLLFVLFLGVIVSIIGTALVIPQSTEEISVGQHTHEYNNTNACIFGCNTMFEKLTHPDLNESQEQTYEEKKCTEICIKKYF